MEPRSKRLKRLVNLQEQIKSLHEMKRANHLSQANAARKDADELLKALNAQSPLPGLFPDIYNRRIGTAIDTEERETQHANREAGKVATATARTKMVEQAWREAAQLEERASDDKERLEIVERQFNNGK